MNFSSIINVCLCPEQRQCVIWEILCAQPSFIAASPPKLRLTFFILAFDVTSSDFQLPSPS